MRIAIKNLLKFIYHHFSVIEGASYKNMKGRSYWFLPSTINPAMIIPASPIHAGRGVYVVFTGTGDEVGTAVTPPVCGGEGVPAGVVVIPGCVTCGVTAGVVSLMNVTEADFVVVPVRSVLLLLSYESCMKLRYWLMVNVYVPRG
jgi:hypothetical protein